MIPDTLYLCATSRLAQTLRQNPRQAGGNETGIWRTPAALTLAQWQAQTAEELLLCGEAMLPPALDADSERLLWEVVLAQAISTETTAELFDLPGLAEEAMNAHALCVQWHLPAPPSTGNDNPAVAENRAFAHWQRAFLQRCEKLQRLAQVDQLERLIGLLRAGHASLPQTVVLAGFDRYTPQEEALFAVFTARGVTLERHDFTRTEEARLTHQACADSLAECHAASAWAQAHLKANPQARLAIVAPDLASVRAPLTALLDAALHPATLRPNAGETPRSYNLSLGEALAQQPLIATALALLRLAGRKNEPIAQADLSPLLLGSFWAGDTGEADTRALGEARLRRKLPATTSWPAVLRTLAAQGMPRTLHALRAAMQAAQAAPRRQLPSQWTQNLEDVLQAAGWPGERTLTSLEFQAQQAFLQLLSELGRYDELLGPQPFSAALQRLGDLCRRRLFQPKTRGEPRIQILGVLESAGLRFDALWVMGMNDERWPPPARPNTLLSTAVQQAAGCSRSSAAVELAFARNVQARLLRAAPQVTLSWAENDGNRMLRPSPLLQPGAVPPNAPPERIATLAATRAACTPLECLADAKAPALAAGELLEGGSGVLRAQALCPAWAFYRYRLAAAALETPVDGLDASLRGTLVHRALEHFWRQTGNQANLLAQDENARGTALAAAIDSALSDFEKAEGMTLPPAFHQLEAKRLHALLLRWLAIEAERPSAFTVLACEEEKTLAVGNLRIRVVIDRLDQLADGSLAVLDYKTGTVDAKSWTAMRISEPQLPLYAAFAAIGSDAHINDSATIQAVSFAKVVLDEPGFSGISAIPEQLPKVAAVGSEKNKRYAEAGLNTWEALIAHWQERIGELAAEIEQGAAAVVFDDVDGLRYCEVLPLLRLAERQRLWQEEVS
jgi:exodeoxyribonuclease-5